SEKGSANAWVLQIYDSGFLRAVYAILRAECPVLGRLDLPNGLAAVTVDPGFCMCESGVDHASLVQRGIYGLGMFDREAKTSIIAPQKIGGRKGFVGSDADARNAGTFGPGAG